KVDIGKLQSYSKQWQYVEASVETSDVISLEKAKQLVSVSQDGKKLKLKWPSEATEGRYFNFTIDSISRKIDDSEILIKWDGKPIGAENKGENTFAIPGQNNFTIVDISSTLAPAALLSINFSDPLLENQDFAGLVTIENTQDLRYEVNGNVLNVYPPNRVLGNVKVTVFTGIKNTEGIGLKNEFSELVSFEQLKPAIDRKSTHLNSSHVKISYAVFCLQKKGLLSSSAASRRLLWRVLNLAVERYVPLHRLLLSRVLTSVAVLVASAANAPQAVLVVDLA